MANELMVQPKNEIVVYRLNATTNLEVRLDEDTVWLAQSQMAELFGCTTGKSHLMSFISAVAPDVFCGCGIICAQSCKLGQ